MGSHRTARVVLPLPRSTVTQPPIGMKQMAKNFMAFVSISKSLGEWLSCELSVGSTKTTRRATSKWSAMGSCFAKWSPRLTPTTAFNWDCRKQRVERWNCASRVHMARVPPFVNWRFMARLQRSKSKIMNSRRNFLKQTGLVGASLVFPSVVPSRVFGQQAPSNRVNLGHIGVGGQGGGLLQGMMGQPMAQSVAVCDPIRERRESVARRVDQYYAGQRKSESLRGCSVYTDFRELLVRPDIDAVVVATPDHWHVPIALAAIRAGKDVYVEKPLGLSIEQDKAIRAAVRLHGRVFQYGTQQRSFSQHC